MYYWHAQDQPDYILTTDIAKIMNKSLYNSRGILKKLPANYQSQLEQVVFALCSSLWSLVM